MNGILKKILSVAVVVAIFVGYKYYKKIQASNEIKQNTIELVTERYSDDMSEEYITELVEYAHGPAMDDAYKPGGKRRSATFNEDAYFIILNKKMGEKLTADGKTKLAKDFE